jgi:hypothetical protein
MNQSRLHPQSDKEAAVESTNERGNEETKERSNSNVVADRTGLGIYK